MEKDIVRSYVRYLKLQRNMSGNTLDAYQRDLRAHQKTDGYRKTHQYTLNGLIDVL